MQTTLASFQLVSRNLDASLKRMSRQPEIAREAKHYLEKISSIDTVEQFLADDRVYRFAMEASGLGDMIYAKAFMRKVLTEGIDDPESFANKLADTRFRDFARRFNFKRYGATATTFTRTQQGIVDDYVRLKLEEDAGQSNEGVRLALYFQRKAPQVRSGYGILADRALMRVAETVIGHSLARGDIDKNAKLVEKRLDLQSFRDPAGLEKFLQRFTAMWEMNNGGAPGQASAPNALLAQPLEAGISQDILQTLQQLKLTGR
jgi:hypothetical protein